MRIVLVLKPYSIEVYSRENNLYTLIGVDKTSHIQDESILDYEKRMIFVCKKLCTEMRASSFFKSNALKLKGIDVVLSSPWCTYDVVQVEKEFEKKTKITNEIIESMFVKKDEKDLCVVESYISNVSLNGYKVKSIDNKTADSIQFQYVHIYAKDSFIKSLTKTLESIFNIHKILITSIYGLTEYVSKMRSVQPVSELQVIVEDESVNVSYLHDGLHVVNMFIPHGYLQLEHSLAMSLSSNVTVAEDILISRGECLKQKDKISIDKNAKKIWPDLDDNVKEKINILVADNLEKIIKYIRNCIDKIDLEYIKSSTCVNVYCVNKKITMSYGLELFNKIVSDQYIIMKINPSENTEPVQSLF